MMGALVVVRTIHFAATLFVAGALAFDFLVAAEDGRARRQHLVTRAALAGHLTAVLWIAVQAAMVGGGLAAVDASLLRTLVADTQFGQVMALRMLLFAALIPKGWPAAKAALGAAVAGSLAWCGHAAAGTGVTGNIHLASDVLHLVAAAAWLGGLVCLADALRPTIPIQRALPIARHFSAVALVSVSGIVASGLVNAWFLVATPDLLFATAYGRALLLKLVLFSGMLAIAAANRWHVLPRVAAGGGIAALRRNAVAETVLGVLVLAAVAWLGVQPPAAHFH